MRLVSLIVVLALAPIAQAHGPAFAPCGGAAAFYAPQSYAPQSFSFQRQAAFVPSYQANAFFQASYQPAFAVVRARSFAVAPVQQVNVNVRRGLFAPRVQVIGGGASQVNVNVGRRGLFR
jgi:hypothetical protein